MNITIKDLETIFKASWAQGYDAHSKGLALGNWESGGWEADWARTKALYAPAFALDIPNFQEGVITPKQKVKEDVD